MNCSKKSQIEHDRSTLKLKSTLAGILICQQKEIFHAVTMFRIKKWILFKKPC